jgi:uncharacterized protein
LRTQDRTITTPLEAVGISALCFGWFVIASLTAVSAGFRNESFSEQGFYGLMAFELVLGAVAILVLRSRGYSTRSLYPRPSIPGMGVGVLVYVAAIGASWVLTSPFGGNGYEEPLEELMANGGISLSTLVALGIVNGTYEEVFLLGFLVRGLRGYGLAVAIGVSLLVRVLCHLYQGPLGALSILAFGLVLSLYYVSTGKLFPVVVAHAVGDIVPFLWP